LIQPNNVIASRPEHLAQANRGAIMNRRGFIGLIGGALAFLGLDKLLPATETSVHKEVQHPPLPPERHGGATRHLGGYPGTIKGHQSGNDQAFAEAVRSYAHAVASARRIPLNKSPEPPTALTEQEAHAVETVTACGMQSCISQRIYNEGTTECAKRYARSHRRPQKPGQREFIITGQSGVAHLYQLMGIVTFDGKQPIPQREQMWDLLEECYCIGYESAKCGKIVGLTFCPSDMGVDWYVVDE
jgi:hypothetical protein